MSKELLTPLRLHVSSTIFVNLFFFQFSLYLTSPYSVSYNVPSFTFSLTVVTIKELISKAPTSVINRLINNNKSSIILAVVLISFCLFRHNLLCIVI